MLTTKMRDRIIDERLAKYRQRFQGDLIAAITQLATRLAERAEPFEEASHAR